MAKEKTLRYKKGRTRIDELGIHHTDYHEGIELSLIDAKEEVERAKIISKGEKVLQIVYLDKVKKVSMLAKQYYAGEESAKVWIAVALLAKSPLSRTIGNLFLKVNKPSFPAKMFSDKKKAMAWLKGFL